MLSSYFTRPLLGLHLLLVVVLVGTGLAGWWQLDTWRDAQRDDAAERAGRPPVPLAEVLAPDDPLANEDDGVPVEVVGTYAPRDQQFLVSGRADEGRDGYWVLSPLEVAGTSPESALLVVRGWVADPGALPPVPDGEVRETGVLAPGEEGSGVVQARRVVDAVRIPALVNAVKTDLYSAFLISTSPPAEGLEPVPPPVTDPGWSAGLRNLAYAMQWWAFGGFAVFLWWRMCAEQRSVASAG